MTEHYFNSEFRIDAEKTPMISDRDLNELLKEAASLMIENELGDWQNSNEWTEGDTQW